MLLYSIVNVEPEPLDGGEVEIPESVDRVIGKALEKEPGSRYADASELLEDLERATEGEAVKGRRVGSRKRGRIIGAVAGAISLICLGLFVWPGFLVPTRAISKLAVMPLEDRSGDLDQGYFAEGVADELATGLQKIGALTIVSRSSANRAQEIYDSNREIGDHLGVEALGEGSVQRDGERVKVSVQLVATEDDRLLWSESYTRDMRDILNLQSEIALAVSSALETHLTPGEQEDLQRDRQVDPEAYELVLKGRFFLNKYTPEGFKKSLDLFQAALKIDPTYATAYAEMGGSLVMGINHQIWADSRTQKLTSANAYLDSALSLDPDLGVAYAYRGAIAMYYEWDWNKADRNFQQAIECDPSLSFAWREQGFLLFLLGEYDQAIASCQKGIPLDPLLPMSRADLGVAYIFAGRLEEAKAEFESARELDPGFWIATKILGEIAIEQGEYAEAIDLFLHCSELRGKPQLGLGAAYAAVGRMDEAEEILDQYLNMPQGNVNQMQLAHLRNALGQPERAMDIIEAEYEAKSSPYLPFEIQRYYFRNLLDNPRFRAIITNLGLPVE